MHDKYCGLGEVPQEGAVRYAFLVRNLQLQFPVLLKQVSDHGANHGDESSNNDLIVFDHVFSVARHMLARKRGSKAPRNPPLLCSGGCIDNDDIVEVHTDFFLRSVRKPSFRQFPVDGL